MLIFVVRKKGFRVSSFGTGNQVKLPGPSPDKPNVYDFSITYDEMYKDLWRKDPDLYPCFLILRYYTVICVRWCGVEVGERGGDGDTGAYSWFTCGYFVGMNTYLEVSLT
jgi:hypothetical protein